ncbi:MAG: Fic family protein [Bryobacterales bacterium]|nr:Fic family protein [Bryobacterales bacterium]
MRISHSWKPIDDLPDKAANLSDGELIALKRVWERQRDELRDGGNLDEFTQRLHREWAIETGIIEDVYTLDRRVTRALIERGIEAALIPRGTSGPDNVKVARIIQDHYETLEGLFDFVGGQRQLSTSYIKELHAALLRNMDTHTVVDPQGQAFEKPLEKGAYKIQPNSPTRADGAVHQYCPPEHVASEMDRLIEMYRQHEAAAIPVEVEAAWLHHRFTQIHPFADGNGRVARALASLVLIKDGWFPLVIDRDDRARYIDALEKADQGDLRGLVDMVVESQRKAVIKATEVALEVKPATTIEQAIEAVRNRLVLRGALPLKEWLAAEDVARNLVSESQNRLLALASQLRKHLAAADVLEIATGGAASQAVLSLPASFGHVKANGFEAGAGILLKIQQGHDLGIYFYSIGPRFRGLIHAVGYFLPEGGQIQPLHHGFLINYEEDSSSAQQRFAPWLEEVIKQGLDAWRRTL